MSDRRSLAEQVRAPQTANERLVSRLVRLAMLTTILVLVQSLAFYFLERNADGTEINTYGDALFWTASQVTTVSSSLPNPLTTGGRILAVWIDFSAIAVVSILFGSIASHLNLASKDLEH